MASMKFLAESGLIINSWIFKSLSACAPPLIIFINGMGKEKVFPRDLNNDFLFDKAEHFELASETARVALAPKFVLFSLPSKSNKALSIFFWSSDSKPFSLSEILLFIFSTAISTLLPKNLFLF